MPRRKGEPSEMVTFANIAIFKLWNLVTLKRMIVG